MSKLLIDDRPLQCLPQLAHLLRSSDRAIILQQIHWLLIAAKESDNQYVNIDDRWWVYKTLDEWRNDYFIWISTRTIQRHLLALEKAGYIVSRQAVKHKSDQTKWYSVNYDKLKDTHPPRQSGTMVHHAKMALSTIVPTCHDGLSEKIESKKTPNAAQKNAPRSEAELTTQPEQETEAVADVDDNTANAMLAWGTNRVRELIADGDATPDGKIVHSEQSRITRVYEDGATEVIQEPTPVADADLPTHLTCTICKAKVTLSDVRGHMRDVHSHDVGPDILSFSHDTTPMWRKSYNAIKAQHPDHIVLYRLGDFYETFDDDAKLIADTLDLTLTSRITGGKGFGKQGKQSVMAGIPWITIDEYVARLVTAGYRVAVVDQDKNAKLSTPEPPTETAVQIPDDPFVDKNERATPALFRVDDDGAWEALGVPPAFPVAPPITQKHVVNQDGRLKVEHRARPPDKLSDPEWQLLAYGLKHPHNHVIATDATKDAAELLVGRGLLARLKKRNQYRITGLGKTKRGDIPDAANTWADFCLASDQHREETEPGAPVPKLEGLQPGVPITQEILPFYVKLGEVFPAATIMTEGEQKNRLRICWELKRAGAKPEHIAVVKEYVTFKGWDGSSFNVCEYRLGEALAWKAGQQANNGLRIVEDAPEIVSRPLDADKDVL